MKNKLKVLIFASILLFMQSYLLQHDLSHAFDDHHHGGEIIQECQMCFSVHQLSQFIPPAIINLSLSLIVFLVLFFYSFINFYSTTLQLPRNRAPPVIYL